LQDISTANICQHNISFFVSIHSLFGANL